MTVRALIVALMTVLAGWLRFTATSFGLPDKFRPDEQYIMGRALGFSNDWNPNFAIYPAAQMYVDHLALILYARTKGNRANFRETYVADDGALAYLVGRRVSAAFGTATIPAIYFAAAPFGPEAALGASALMAISTLHVRESKYATTDAGAIFWLTLCLVMVMRMIYCGEERYYLAAGLFAGLAAATKYPAGILIFAIAAAHVEARAREGRSLWRSFRDIRIYLAGFATVAAFVCATPYFFLDWPQTFNDYVYQRGFVLDGLPNPLATYGWSWLLLHAMPDSFGISMLLLLLVAMAWMAFRRRPGVLSLLVFVLVACTVMTRSRYVFYRYLVVPLPGMIVLAGAFFADLVKLATPRLGALKARALLGWGLALLILPSFIRDIELNRLLLRADSRTVAREWIERNIPIGSEIAATDVGNLCGKPQLSEGYRWVPLASLDSLRGKKVRFVVSDSFPPIEFYSRGPSKQEAEELDSKAKLVLKIDTIEPGKPMPVVDPADAYYAPIANISSMERAGPTIRIWELPITDSAKELRGAR